ncbi:MAG: outer membrane protein assembly factor BamA [Hyphomicrobiales bacterium]|nr:MAG: outer membrane protein assembly factor BamA [Hyphomicrobiales bacterium]
MRAKLRALVTAASVALFVAVAPVMGAGLSVIGAQPAEAAVVSRIDVVGVQRVDAETVRTYLTISPRRSFGADDVDASLKALFATGLFSDVNISQRGSALVVTVVENPVINRVSIEGNKKQKDEILLTQIQSKPRSVLTRAKVQSDVQRILEIYRRTGRFRASVEPKIISLAQNRVDLVFEVDEGDKTGIARITFIGNKAFSDGRLRDVIKTRETGLLGWLRTTDSYDPDRLNADQELLRQFYYQRGYADFRIISAVADLDRERNTFFVTFTVEEGEEYTYGDVQVQSTLASADPETLRASVETDPGSTYDSREVEKSLEELVLQVAEKGYAFAQVRPRGDRDYENRTISITYYVDEGPRVYIDRINIRGNTRTRDYVIRREFDVAEGDAFNRVLINKAERRLKDLNYFKSVRITTTPGTAPDRVVVNVDVEEQATGAVSFGAGYSTSEGIIGDISVTERNFLGRGQYVKLAVGGGESRETYDFAFTEPYFMGRRLSAGINLYRHVYEENDYRQYNEEVTGGGLNFGLPLNDEMTFNTFYQAYERKFDVVAGLKDGCSYSGSGPVPASCDANNDGIVDADLSAAEVSRAVKQSIGTTFTSLVGYSLVYDTLDDQKMPHEGIYAMFKQEFAGVGGDVTFLRTTVEGRYYQEIMPDWGVIGMAKAKAGYITGLGERLRLPDHFFIGGETIRGFESQGIGPRDRLTGDALGGRAYIAGTVEANFPIPVLPSELGFYGAVFADAGTLWDVDPKAARGVPIIGNDGALRASLGAGLLWDSPFGLIRADFAWPVMKEDYDQEQVFRIGGGTTF